MDTATCFGLERPTEFRMRRLKGGQSGLLTRVLTGRVTAGSGPPAIFYSP
jgi:hypothetical protein